MNCSMFEEYASLYIDEMLTEEEMINLKKHLKTCENCSISLDNLKTIVGTVNEMEEIELPDNFTLSLREKLQVETEKENKNLNKKPFFNFKILGGVAAGFLIISMSLTALDHLPNFLGTAKLAGDSNEYSTSVEFDQSLSPQATSNTFGTSSVLTSTGRDELKPVETEELAIFEDSTTKEVNTTSLAMENRKIINRGRLVLETHEFEQVQQKITNIVEVYGGYFENADTQYKLLNRERPEDSLKSKYMIIRVPSGAFHEIFRELKLQGIVINENTNAQDVTLTYRDVENEVMNLEIQEERLREILKKADKVEDILRIENELSRVRLHINSMKGTLKSYDQLISLSTIEIEVNEIKDGEIRIQSVKVGVWGKAKADFIKSVNEIINFAQSSFIKFYGFIPWALLLTVILGPLVNLSFKYIKKRRSKNEK